MKKKKYLLSFFIWSILCLILTQNVMNAQSKAEKIDQLIQIYYDYGLFNGSVLVAHHDQILFEKGYGYANYEWNIPNSPDTKFKLGSVTKQFTAMLVMQLVQDKKLTLNTKVSDCYHGYSEPQGSKITIYHLLTHRSGIPNFTSYFNFRTDRKPYRPDELVQIFSSRSLDFEPGTNYRYSNSNYVLLGAIIEKLTGKTYSQLLKEKIFTPTGMDESGYFNSEELVTKRAEGYDRLGGISNAQYIDMTVAYAAGGIYSTVRDLYRWNMALYSTTLLNEMNRDIYFKPILNNYACGWGVRNVQIGESTDSTYRQAHAGGIFGFGSFIARFPEDGYFIVLLNNTGETQLAEMIDKITCIIYDKPFSLPHKSAAETFTKLLKSGIKISAEDYYNEAISKDQSDIYFNEEELNMAGYYLIGINKIREAIEVLKLAVLVFPNSANTFDSLGEAYMLAGDTKLAINNYKKSLELNPDNDNALKMLEKLKK